ncbi:MAG TPA: hypothetical protein GXX28_05380, partial [Firmicutes bacterium]|nr:hypothetical protein [Bacillota bacterium]
VSGPGPIKAASETQICVFCHIPHNASPAVPLWGHTTNSGTYTIYTSSTIQGSSGQPNGSSKLCLACHDGAVAIGAVIPSYSYPSSGSVIAMTGTGAGGVMPAGATNLGTDLRNDHPVSLLPATGPNADPEIMLTPADTRVKYDSTGQVQCTSCHNPHDNTYGKFLVMPNVSGGIGSQLCIGCHAKFNWTNSAHRNATNTYNGQTIQAQACAICHKTHTAPIPARLLLGSEEALCNTCHNGSTTVNPTIKNVAGEFARAYRHPLSTSGKHDPTETFTDLNDSLKRHSECEDCHNPHSAQAGTHRPPNTSGFNGDSKIGAVLLGAWGMKPIYSSTPMSDPVSWEKVVFTDTTGADMLEAYLCFKCHKDQAKFFNPANPSYHACVGPPKASTYGGYVSPWSRTSQMTCSDCHTSSNTTIKGPHGSDYAANNYKTGYSNPVILFADYKRANGKSSGTGASGTDTHLCFKCHLRSTYGGGSGGSSGFSTGTNNLHNSGHDRMACTICHHVHGSSRRALLTTKGDSWSLGSMLVIRATTLPEPRTWQGRDCDHSSCN